MLMLPEKQHNSILWSLLNELIFSAFTEILCDALWCADNLSTLEKCPSFRESLTYMQLFFVHVHPERDISVLEHKSKNIMTVSQTC